MTTPISSSEQRTAAAAPRKYDQKFSLLVGVNRALHSSLTTLKHCESDVAALADVLKNHGYSVRKLIGDNASSLNIINELNKTITEAKTAIQREIKHSDTAASRTAHVLIYFHFSGHGEEESPTDTTDSINQKGMVGLNLFTASGGNLSGDTHVKLSNILAVLMENKQLDYIITIDACRSLAQLTRDTVPGNTPQVVLRNLSNNNQYGIVFFSAGSGQQAIEGSVAPMGDFTSCLVKALRGGYRTSKQVTWRILYSYVSENLRSLTNQAAEANGSQEDFVIIDDCIPPETALLDLAVLARHEVKGIIEKARSLLVDCSSDSYETFYDLINNELEQPEPRMMRVMDLLREAYEFHEKKAKFEEGAAESLRNALRGKRS